MGKKRTIKILSSIAIAASAFVATTPTEAASISEVEKLVTNAKNSGIVLKWAISIEGTADGTSRPWAAYNNAKTSYDHALKAVNTLPSSQRIKYTAELEEHVKIHINRTMHYIDAITAGEKIREKQAVLANQVRLNIVDDRTEKAYHELSSEIRKQAILLDRVYGQSTRDLIRSQYKKSAETVRDNAKYPVTVKIELDLAARALAANDAAKAEKHFSEATKYLKQVDNAVMKKALTERLNTMNKNFTPKVDKVSAVESKRITIQFNKAMLNGNSTNSAENTSNYAVTGQTIKSAKLSDDKKTATIELYDVMYPGSSYTVTTRKNIQTASYESLGTTDLTSSFTFSDTVKPTVLSVVTHTNGNVEINFSEIIDRNSPFAIKINGTAVTPVSLSDHSDMVTVSKAELDRLGLRKGRSYSVSVTGIRDLVIYNPNTMNTYSSSFIYNPAADVIAPHVRSVTVKDERTLTVEFSETIADFNASSHLVVTKGSATIRPTSVKDVSDGKKTKFDVELPASIYGTNESSVQIRAQIKSYKDLGDNIGSTIERSVVLTKDVTTPSFVRTTYDISADEIQIMMNKSLGAGTPTANSITLYDKDNKVIKPTLKANVDNKIIINAKDLPDGVYTINVSAGTVKDRTISQNQNSAFVTSITKKKDIVKPTVTFLPSGENGKFTAAFSEAVTTDSAQSTANYLLNGKALPVGTTFTMSLDQKVVTITLPEGEIQATKNYTITAKGIKDLSENVMNDYAVSVSLKDNTRPDLISATIVNKEMKLTFSENITLADNGLTSFEIMVDDKKLAINNYQIRTTSNKKELFITPGDDTLFGAAEKITISVTDVAQIRDSEGNILKVGDVINVK